MDSCARCGRHLDEDRVCPECDDTQAAGTPPAPEAEERYYRAKPFPQPPPPHVVAPTPDPVTEELPVAGGPEESPADDAAPDEPPSHEDGFQDATAAHEEADDGEPRPRRRFLILAACLGAVLLGAVVYGFAGPGLPWGGSTVSEKHDTPHAGMATDEATNRPRPASSEASPSSDAPSASQPEKPTATPSPSGPPQAEPPAPATTADRAPTQPPAPKPPAPKPTRSSADPTTPPSDHPSPSPSQSCFLIFCR